MTTRRLDGFRSNSSRLATILSLLVSLAAWERAEADPNERNTPRSGRTQAADSPSAQTQGESIPTRVVARGEASDLEPSVMLQSPEPFTPDLAPSETTIEEIQNAIASGSERSRGDAQGPASPFSRPGGDRPPVGYRTMWQPSRPVEGQTTNLSLWQHEVNASAPVYMSEANKVFLSTGFQADLFQTDAILPDSDRFFPNELWTIRFGVNYIHKFNNGWTGGTILNIGSGSDRPFDQIRDINPAVIAFLGIPHGERNAWNLSLFYSPLSELPFPIPGVAYVWNPSEKLRMNIGLPAQVTYRPIEELTFDFSYMVMRTIHAQATYRFLPRWATYFSFDWENQSWFLHDREIDRQRLFSYDKRLSLGLRHDLSDHLSIDLSGGYLFDRFYFTGEEYSDNWHDRIDIANGAFVALQAGLTW